MTKCIFCAIINKTAPAVIVDEDDHTMTILDIKPLFPGHCLIMPKKHFITLPELPDEVVKVYFSKVKLLSAAIPIALRTQGTFVAINNIVSQSVPHLHTHVVPRQKGDGLKGFFWPRHPYRSEKHKIEVAEAIKEALRF